MRKCIKKVVSFILVVMMTFTSINASALAMENDVNIHENELSTEEVFSTEENLPIEEKLPTEEAESVVSSSEEETVSSDMYEDSSSEELILEDTSELGLEESGKVNELLVESGSCGENVEYMITGDPYEGYSLSIVGYGPMADYKIYENRPKRNKPAPWYKYADKLISYEIDDRITKIGAYSFYDCKSLSGELVIPEGVSEIGEYAFYDCSNLTGRVNLPEGLTEIADGTFYGCEGLSGINNLNDKITRIGEYGFCGCTGFTGKLIIGSNISEVGIGAFEDCVGLTGTLVIESSETIIGAYAFAYCDEITGISFPNGTQSISDGEFSHCINLKGPLNIPDTVTSIGEEAFKDCNKLSGNLIIPEGVESIEQEAFSGCSGFDGNLVIPNSVTTIKNSAFEGCSGLTGELTIGDNVSNIGKYAFKDCNGFTSCTIGENCSGSSFIVDYCKGLLRVTNKSQNTVVLPVSMGNYWCVENDETFTEIYELSADTSAIRYRRTNENGIVKRGACGENLQYEIKENEKNAYTLTISGTGAMTDYASNADKPWNYCITRINRLVISDGVTRIGSNAFNGATEIEGELVIPQSVVTIGDRAFANCYKLTGKLSIPSSVKIIEEYAFYECYRLNGIEFNEGIETIAGHTFWGCSGITGSLILPSSVTAVESCAFAFCSKIACLHIKGNVEQFNSDSFADSESELTKVINDGNKAFQLFAPAGQIWVREGDTDEVAITSISNGTAIRIAKKQEPEAPINVDITLNPMNDEATSTISVEYGKTYGTLPTPEKEDCIFDGWYTRSEGGTLIESTTQVEVTSDQTLYAHWIHLGLRIENLKSEYEYTGSQIKPDIRVFDGDKLLVEKKDYTVAYKNNTVVNDVSEISKTPTLIVTGKGNYSDKEIAQFNIVKKSIATSDISVSDIAPTYYNKKEQKPVPKITCGKKTLSSKNDFFVYYYSDKACTKPVAPCEAGDYYVQIVGKNNYKGQVIRKFVIANSQTSILVSKLTIQKIKDIEFTGDEIELNSEQLIVKNGKNPINLNEESFCITYSNNIEIGTATVSITGDGVKYIGSKTATFKIVGTPLNKATITIPKNTYIYDGQEKTITGLSIIDKKTGRELSGVSKSAYSEMRLSGKRQYDYVYEYTNNVNVGTASVAFTGVNRYTGSVKKVFKIQAYDLAADPNEKIECETLSTDIAYSKAGSKPGVRVSFGGILLEEGKDYTLSYSANTAVTTGTTKNLPTVVVNGKGNFKGTNKSCHFVIVPREVTDEDTDIYLVLSDMVASSKKNGWKSTVSVVDSDGKKLTVNRDYSSDIEYVCNGEAIQSAAVLPVGTLVDVKVTLKGNYSGVIKGQYKIIAQNIAKLNVVVNNGKAFEYTGKSVELAESDIVFKSGKTTIEGVTYYIDSSSYVNNTNKGKASVTIVGTGQYGGKKVLSYNIGTQKFIWWWNR